MKDVNNLREYLTGVIKEELRKKGRLVEGDDEQPPAPVAQGASPEPSQDPNSEAGVDKKKLQDADIATDDVIDKLNTIRSGRSFKDSAVKGSLTTYIDELEPAERTALYAFLKGISQIVTGEIPGNVATEPGDKPADVQMQKEPASQKKTVKPNVIKSAAPAKQQQQVKKSTNPNSGREDTSSPLPVSPKKRNG